MDCMVRASRGPLRTHRAAAKASGTVHSRAPTTSRAHPSSVSLRALRAQAKAASPPAPLAQLASSTIPPSVASLLKQLQGDIAAHGGTLSAASTSLLTQIQAEVAAQGYVQLLPSPAALAGDWVAPQKFFAMKEVENNKAILSRFCWGLFQPANLPVQLGDTVLRYGADGSFTICMQFTVLHEDGSAGPAGLWETIGSAAPAPDREPNTEQVTMLGGRISPGPGAALGDWLGVFAAHNPSMGGDGVAEARLPTPMVAYRDILLHGEGVLVQLGKGSHGEVLSLLQRVRAPGSS